VTVIATIVLTLSFTSMLADVLAGRGGGPAQGKAAAETVNDPPLAETVVGEGVTGSLLTAFVIVYGGTPPVMKNVAVAALPQCNDAVVGVTAKAGTGVGVGVGVGVGGGGAVTVTLVDPDFPPTEAVIVSVSLKAPAASVGA
jgi:hypothetical protein